MEPPRNNTNPIVPQSPLSQAERFRLRQCGNKTRYETAVQATKAAYQMEALRRGREVFDVYKCQVEGCPYYHIGHRIGTPKDRAR